jgi:hypothetical protein
MKKASILIILISLFSVALAKTTFFSENFDSDWSNSIPPSDWIITNDSLGSSGWDKDSAGSHWSDNHSGYAEISYASKDKFLHRDLDSLVSPIVDCNRFRNIILRCSTYFRQGQVPYTAKIIGSINGGTTYPYLVKSYYGEWFSVPKLESISLDWASEKDSVRIAWVFSGNITYIAFWCLDNVSLVGDSVYDTDASCIEILRPFVVQPPVACTIKARVVNLGKNDLISFPVCCSIADFIGSSWYFQATCDFLLSGETTDVKLSPVWVPNDIPLSYQARTWTEVFGDENSYNDTSQKSFSVSSYEVLSYCGSPVAGENFPTYNQGWGVKFTPSFYPALLTKIVCFLGTTLPSFNCPYKIRIVDDDGIDYAPGTTLYETDIINGHIEWNDIYITADTIFITNGSVYLFYIQVGDVPVAPLLFHDGSRTDSAQYYKYVDSTYVQDLPDGDWILLLTVQYLDFSPFDNDLRTVYITHPYDEFVRRPFDYQTKVKARIENIGNLSQSNFAVGCSIISYDGGWWRYSDIETIPFLGSGQATIVEFSPAWNVLHNERKKIKVYTGLNMDQNQNNNRKIKNCVNTIGKFYNYDSISGYSWYDSDTTDGPEFSWIEPNGAYPALDFGDDTIFSIPLTFSFPYADSIYNRLYVSTNGFLTFSNQQPSASNNSIIPNPDEPNCALYLFWDDLILPYDQPGKICYQTIGSIPNRKFVVTWYNIARKNTDYSQRLNFQAVLYENGNVLFQYKDVICGDQSANCGKDATIGIENKDGTSGLLYLYGSETQTTNWPENKLSNQRAIKFYKPLWDVGPIAKISPEDSIVPNSVTPRIIVRNNGTEVAESIRVYLSTSPSTYNAFYFIPRIIAGKQDTILFPNWDANITGQYTVICSTSYRLDQYHQNNVLQKSVLVSKWILKHPIPEGPSITRVKNGALAYDFDENKIYALKGGNCNEFWCYDIATNQWESLPRMPKQPSNKKPKAGCALTYSQGRIYALKGGNTNDFYEYDPDSLRWNSLAPIKDTVYAPNKKPKDGAGLVFSSIDGLYYAILGNNTNVLLKYDPGGNRWYYEAQTPNAAKIRDGGSITFYPPPSPDYDTLLYVFQGKSTKNLWRYDIRRHNWLERCTIPYPKVKIKSGAASTCQTGLGIIYFFIGGNKQSVFRYNIGTNSFDSVTPIPLGPDPRSGRLRTKVKKGAAFVATTNDLIYAFKSGNTNEFWAFAFWGETPGVDGAKRHQQSVVVGQSSIPINHTIQSTSLDNYLSISYTLKQKNRVELKLYSITGELLETLCNQEQLPGNYQITLDGIGKHKEKLKGIYFIKGRIGSEQIQHKIIRL